MDKGRGRIPGPEGGLGSTGPQTGDATTIAPVMAASGTSSSITAPLTLVDMALSTPTTAEHVAVTTSGMEITTPSTAATTAVGISTQGVGITAPGVENATPAIGTTTPGTESTTSGVATATPDITTTTPYTEAAASKVLEALTASAAEAAAASTANQTKEEDVPSSPQFPSDQDKRKKNRQTTKLKSVLSNEPQRRQNVPQEEEFLRAVEAGDFPSVRRMLRNKPGLDVNCTDLLGRTPLRIAVQNENQEIVEILLDRAGTRNMYESLLLAISLDQESIALCILRHPMYTKVEQQTRLYSNDSIFLSSNSEDSLFEAETTPLILAAQRNSYEVLSLLLDRGAKIEEPHDASCDCSHCKANIKLDDLRNAKSRLNAYKGLTSEAYICLSSPDPFLSAFNLRRKLKKVARNEKHYRDEYEALQKKLGQFVVRLLDCVRGDEELEVLLNQAQDGQYELLGRLNLAIRYDEKKFVAHSSCQKKLGTMWYGDGLQYMNRSPSWARPIFVIVCGIMFPISSLVYFFAPTPKVRAFMQTPFVKFIHQSTSFFVFLVLICLFSLTEKPSHANDNFDKVQLNMGHDEEQKMNLTRAGIAWSEHYREYVPPTIFTVLNVFVVGMIWQECKQMYCAGPKDYFGSMFNLMDTFSLALYVTSFALRYVSYYKTYEAHVYLESEAGLKALIAGEDRALYFYYWMYADRHYWDAFDPMVVAEGLFAMANVVSFSRLFYLLAANEQLGPLQISLRRMVGDISRFMAIFLIIFVAFMVGLNNLYWYYEPGVRGVVELPTHEPLITEAEEAFGTIEKTFTTVFWSIFGMGESSVVWLGDGFAGAFTERVGYIVFGLYNVAIVIILMNMLIAMMSRSFEAIVDDQDIEWKFARAQLYMDFIQDGCTLPVPFNIIPTPKTLYRLGAALFSRCKKRQEPPQQLNNVRHLQTNGVDVTDYALNRISSKSKLTNMDSISLKSTVCHSEGKGESSSSESTIKKIQHLGKKLYKQKEENTAAPTTSFSTVMKRLVKRYIFESERVDNSPLEGDMDELKQDLSGLRYELNNLIHQHQKKTNNSVHLLTTKLDFLISIVVSKGGEVHPQTSGPTGRIGLAKAGLQNAVNIINKSNHFHTKAKVKSRFSRFSPHQTSVTDGGTRQEESANARDIHTDNTKAEQAKAKGNQSIGSKSVFRHVKFNRQSDQKSQKGKAPRDQGNDTPNGPGVQPHLGVDKGNLQVSAYSAAQRGESYREKDVDNVMVKVLHNKAGNKPQLKLDKSNLTEFRSSRLERRGSFREVDVDSMEVTVIEEESDTDNTDHSSSSYTEDSDHLQEGEEEEEGEDSSKYSSHYHRYGHRGKPYHPTATYRDPNSRDPNHNDLKYKDPNYRGPNSRDDPNYSSTYPVDHGGTHEVPHPLRSTQCPPGPEWHSTPEEHYTTHRQQNIGHAPGEDTDYGAEPEEEEEEEEEEYDFVERKGHYRRGVGGRGTYHRGYGSNQWMDHGDSVADSSDVSVNASIGHQGTRHHQEGARAPPGVHGRYQFNYVNEAYEEDGIESASDEGDGRYPSTDSFHADSRDEQAYFMRPPSHSPNSDRNPLGRRNSIDC